MNPIEELLSEVNRLFEEDVLYFPAGDEDGIAVKATRERTDTADYLESGAPQSFRLVSFSFSREDLLTSAGAKITPRRGDKLKAKDGIYRLVEIGGIAFVPRFDAGFDGRILTYWEREGGNA